LSKEQEQEIKGQIEQALKAAAIPPQKRKEIPQPRWTVKRLVQWVKERWGIDCSRETLRKTLKRLGLSWKKARKLLNKADPLKRAAYLKTLKELLNQALHEQCLLVYVDEAHVYLDTTEGYGWSIRGQRFWVSSSSPGRQKVSFFGLYLYNLAQVRVFPFEVANQESTVEMLQSLRVEFPDVPLKLIWDGAPYHRAQSVRDAATALALSLEPLPPYSPDFMPVEHLWHWLRSEVTYHACYDHKADLLDQVSRFIARINAQPLAVADRLWVQSHLEPSIEKLRFST